MLQSGKRMKEMSIMEKSMKKTGIGSLALVLV